MDKTKIKPILFNTEMVKAILDGRKTVTRRIIKNGKHTPTWIGRDKFYTFVDKLNGKPFFGAGFYKDSDIFCVDGVYHTDAIYFKMPYKVGDILYVRETWLKADDGYHFKADIDIPSESNDIRNAYGYKWRPSIHMPKEASRIFLKVTDVRVDRLQKISEDECYAEGYEYKCPYEHRVAVGNPYYGDGYEGMCWSEGDCRNPDKVCDLSIPEHFGMSVWNSTIKKQDIDRYGWDSNPWVWVYEFERVNFDG